MGLSSRTAGIFVAVIGIVLLIAIALYFNAYMSKVYASTGVSGTPIDAMRVFDLSNIECALKSMSCDIMPGNS
jgi:hypothetical protein